MSVTLRRQGPRETVARIASNRLPEQFERFDRLVLFPGLIKWQGTQVEIVGGQIASRPLGRTADFGRLQCWLDDAGNARRHLVLKLEDVFERAVEPIGPEMRVAGRIDQLRGDTHPV